jgi:hypothetical protein
MRTLLVGIPSMDGIFLGHNLLLSQAFRWESLDGWDFSRPQLVVVSGLSVGIPRWMGFRLSGSPFHELILFFDGISAITEPFTRTFFLFSQWNSGYQGAFHTNFFSFFTMEFWLSRSLSHELLFFHDGILAIEEPFTRTFLFFTMEFQDTKYETCNLGENSFHIYIRKSIYIGSASLKTLPLDLEPPLQGKEYGPSYSRTTIKTKNLFSPEVTYRHVIRASIFLQCIPTKIEKLLRTIVMYN